jgi:type I restriction enzyme S subunit
LVEIQIPIPPLPVQKEIVRILDTFTALTAALTAELTARKKQYSYYQEQLLSFEEGEVEWKTLGEVTILQRGKRLVKSQLEETGKYAVYQNAMTPLGYYHECNVKAYTTFVICAGAAGEVGFSDVNCWAADDVTYFITPDFINNRYVYYYLQTQQHKILSQVRRASVPRLSKTVLEKLIIPIPPLKEQLRIVTILDKFDILTTSISEGLPKEIELRKKQYEYYRDLLLTFKK